MKLKRLVGMLLAICLFLSLVTTFAQSKKQVMTTFYPVYYLVQRIGGEHIEAHVLLSGNEDAHDYEPTAKDVAAIQRADVFVYQDDEMEHFVSTILPLLDEKTTKIVEATDGIELLEGENPDGEEEEHHHGHGEHHHEAHHHDSDPHTWLSPTYYARQAETIKNALIEADSANKATYEANYQALVEELTQLDKEYKEKLAKLTNKTIVVQHAAFGYLAHEYGLTQKAISGLSSTTEPSAAVLAVMQKFVKENNVYVIYAEPSLSPAIAQVVATASGATLKALYTLESVPEGEDYFSLMRYNLDALTSP